MNKNNVLIVTTVIAALAVGFVAGLLFTPQPSTDRYYTAAAIITEISKEHAIAKNSTRTFIIEETDDWQLGDFVSFLIDSHNTDTILDDTVIQIRYNNIDTEGEYRWIVNTSQQ